MKYEFCFIAFLAFVSAQGIQDETPSETHDEDAYSTLIPYSVPAPSAGYPAAPSDMIVPSALPTKGTSDDSCSTALITITTTRTVSMVTQIPSSLLTVTGIVELSSFMPSQPPPPWTSATDVIGISSWATPQPASSATDTEESGVAPPQAPYPTSSDTPISTTAIVTTSATSAGLPVFTDAADAVRVPVVVAGILWWAALVL